MKQLMIEIKRVVLDLKYYFERSLPLVLAGAALGYYFAKQQEPVEIGFATVKDMSFLVQELQECKEASSYETN